jgi:hypothetical protein
MKTKTTKGILVSLAVLSLVVVWASSLYMAFWFGRLAAALEPSRVLERPMCAAYPVDIRTDPTGYIIGHVPAGGMLWFYGLDLPFARVAYYDGDEWLVGTVTASALEVCGDAAK